MLAVWLRTWASHVTVSVWIRYCYCVSCALSSFAVHLNHPYWLINGFGNMSLRTGSFLALGFAVLNIVRPTKEWRYWGTTWFSFFLTTSVRSIALYPLRISFEALVRWISSEAHFTCAQKRLGCFLKSLLLLDFSRNWERVDKAWC